ncbi:hypothetical protein AYI69_g7502, partial [Smittium culicis]
CHTCSSLLDYKPTFDDKNKIICSNCINKNSLAQKNKIDSPNVISIKLPNLNNVTPAVNTKPVQSSKSKPTSNTTIAFKFDSADDFSETSKILDSNNERQKGLLKLDISNSIDTKKIPSENSNDSSTVENSQSNITLSYNPNTFLPNSPYSNPNNLNKLSNQSSSPHILSTPQKLLESSNKNKYPGLKLSSEKNFNSRIARSSSKESLISKSSKSPLVSYAKDIGFDDKLSIIAKLKSDMRRLSLNISPSKFTEPKNLISPTSHVSKLPEGSEINLNENSDDESTSHTISLSQNINYPQSHSVQNTFNRSNQIEIPNRSHSKTSKYLKNKLVNSRKSDIALNASRQVSGSTSQNISTNDLSYTNIPQTILQSFDDKVSNTPTTELTLPTPISVKNSDSISSDVSSTNGSHTSFDRYLPLTNNTSMEELVSDKADNSLPPTSEPDVNVTNSNQDFNVVKAENDTTPNIQPLSCETNINKPLLESSVANSSPSLVNVPAAVSQENPIAHTNSTPDSQANAVTSCMQYNSSESLHNLASEIVNASDSYESSHGLSNKIFENSAFSNYTPVSRTDSSISTDVQSDSEIEIKKDSISTSIVPDVMSDSKSNNNSSSDSINNRVLNSSDTSIQSSPLQSPIANSLSEPPSLLSSQDIHTDVETETKGAEFAGMLKAAINEISQADSSAQNTSNISLTDNESSFSISKNENVASDSANELPVDIKLTTLDQIIKPEYSPLTGNITAIDLNKISSFPSPVAKESALSSKPSSIRKNFSINFNSNRALKSVYNSNVPRSVFDLPDLRKNRANVSSIPNHSFSSSKESSPSIDPESALPSPPMLSCNATIHNNNNDSLRLKGSLIGSIRGLRGIEDALNKPSSTDLDSLFGFRPKNSIPEKVKAPSRRLSSPLGHIDVLKSRPNPRGNRRQSVEKTLEKQVDDQPKPNETAPRTNKNFENFSQMSFSNGSLPHISIRNGDNLIQEILDDSDGDEIFCSKCKNEIHESYFSTEDGSKVHASCFSCQLCDRLIDDGIYIFHEGASYHPVCAPELPTVVEINNVPNKSSSTNPSETLVPLPRPEASLFKNLVPPIKRISSVKRRIKDYIDKQNRGANIDAIKTMDSIYESDGEIEFSDAESVSIEDEQLSEDGSDDKFCHRCNLLVDEAVLYISDNNYYHPACFTCFGCSERFEQGSYVLYEGNTYHRHCAPLIIANNRSDESIYSDSSSEYSDSIQDTSNAYVAFTCPTCSLAINGEYINHNDTPYHKTCFICCDCKKSITADVSFGELEGCIPCCEDCLNLRFPV